jgi:hypothetical protein
MVVSIQLYSTAAGARWTGGWVGPTVGLEFEMPLLGRLFDSSQTYNPRPVLTELFRLPLGSYIAHFTLWKRCPLVTVERTFQHSQDINTHTYTSAIIPTINVSAIKSGWTELPPDDN